MQQWFLALSIASLVAALFAVYRCYRVQLKLSSRYERYRIEANERLDSKTRTLESQLAEWEILRQKVSELERSSQSTRDVEQRLLQIETMCHDSAYKAESAYYEVSKMAYLPRCNPKRIALLSSLTQKLEPVTANLERVLFTNHIPLDDADWMYKLKNRLFPYSLTTEEGMVLYKIVYENKLQHGFEIATAFGFSSFFLGLAVNELGGSLLSMDAYIEESQEHYLYDADLAKSHAETIRKALRMNDVSQMPDGLQFATSGARTLGIADRITYEVGFSPDGVAPLLEGKQLDFAFIDGGHFGEQPVRDVDVVVPFLNKDRFALFFHDTHCDAVAKGVFHAMQLLEADMFSINTRNRIVVVSRGLDKNSLEECRQIISRQSN